MECKQSNIANIKVFGCKLKFLEIEVCLYIKATKYRIGIVASCTWRDVEIDGVIPCHIVDGMKK